jgi:hypothetical protein
MANTALEPTANSGSAADAVGGGSPPAFGFIVKVTFSFEGHLDIAALKVLQNQPFTSVETVRGYTNPRLNNPPPYI